MAQRKPLVIVDGQLQQLQAGDTLDATVNEVDVVSKQNDNAGALVKCTPVYVKSNGNVDKAQADAAATVEVLGLVKDTSIAAGASGNIQTDGVLSATTAEWDAVAGTTGGLTPGAVYYLDPATVGEITEVAPTATGEFVVRAGLALSDTELDISVQEPIKL